MSQRQSTADRRRERNKCRETLAQHIYPYAWRVLAGNEFFLADIFAKNLSDHTVSVYRRLGREVGRIIEAVAAESTHDGVGGSLSSGMSFSSTPSFEALISELRAQCDALSTEIDELRRKENVEAELRQAAEEELSRLQCQGEEQERELQQQADELAFYKTAVTKCATGLEQALPFLQHLRADIIASAHARAIKI
ncbi:hypothetical protein SPI_01422 [Niveomyces insectorum RCEF 264]|uniref:Uncharacterized protein n=1 Tax=Niveomyces insectorum RCEF 264 TaxID=1081102 RepID=A0A167YYE7_9HYPO|nr:hypothetical protein SPI_01422 [Niveomyces insectorum RCEF 264]